MFAVDVDDDIQSMATLHPEDRKHKSNEISDNISLKSSATSRYKGNTSQCDLFPSILLT